MSKTFNILFLCTKNSARSILGEVIATTISRGKFRGFSAGSKPAKFVHPIALRIARDLGYPLEALRSKSWDEFGAEGAPHMDFIITVCDSAAGEECPYWPGHPATAHWGFPDPDNADLSDSAKFEAFKEVEIGLRNRLDLLMDLKFDTLDHMAIKEYVQSVHHRLKFQ